MEEFKKNSNKVFSPRSAQLRAIDMALARVHTVSLATNEGTLAMVELIEAIANWRKFKLQQGKTSGRARAVDKLQAQLAQAAESMYKRKIGEQKVVDTKIHTARNLVNQDLHGLGLGQGKAKIPTFRPPSPPQRPLPPLPSVKSSIPVRGPAEDRLFDHLAQALIDQRRKAMAYDDEDLFDDLDVKQKGRLAARWMLCVPDEVKDVAAARAEALRVLAAMLGNDVGTIKNLLSNNLEVVVIPRDKGMTVLDQFESIRGQNTFDGRSWDAVRGVGNVQVPSSLKIRQELIKRRDSGRGPGCIVAIDPSKGRIYTAVTEENLLGGLTTAPGAGCYDTGYSTTTHEFAHSIHYYGLSKTDFDTIGKAYQLRLGQGENEMWVDGPRKVGAQTCYAAMTVAEYFAQLSNAWLGVNSGNDPYTRRPRNNGRKWVLDHEPKMVSDILERVYGQKALQDLNPAVILKS